MTWNHLCPTNCKIDFFLEWTFLSAPELNPTATTVALEGLDTGPGLSNTLLGNRNRSRKVSSCKRSLSSKKYSASLFPNLAVIEIKITSNQCLKSVQPADLPSVSSAVTAPTSAFALIWGILRPVFVPASTSSPTASTTGPGSGVAHAQTKVRFQLKICYLLLDICSGFVSNVNQYAKV